MSETLAPAKPRRLIINGEAVDAASGRTFTTMNPATEEPICAVAEAGPEDVYLAVKAARAAFDGRPCPRLQPAERQRLLCNLGVLVLVPDYQRVRLNMVVSSSTIFAFAC